MSFDNIDFQFVFTGSSGISEKELIQKFVSEQNIRGINKGSFHQILEDSCKQEIKKAFINLNIFLKEININIMLIKVDLEKSFNHDASYFSGFADFTNGKFAFSLDRNILIHYINLYFNPACKLPLRCKYLWEHELTHLIDHNKVITCAFRPVSGIGSFWINYLLEYRKEGVAELYALFNGIKQIENSNKALLAFQTELSALNKINWNALCGESVMMNKICKTNSFYSIGPWMVIHALSSLGEHYSKQIDLCLNELDTCGKVSHLMTTWIIRKALLLDNEQFISALFIPGMDGQSFLTHQTKDNLNLKLKLANISKPGFPLN